MTNSVSGTNDISVISDVTNKVVATLSEGNEPIGVAYDSAKSELFVANYFNGIDSTVSVIGDTSSASGTTSTVSTPSSSTVSTTSSSPGSSSSISWGYIGIVAVNTALFLVLSGSMRPSLSQPTERRRP